MILAHWTYSREEWNAFLKSTKRRRGILSRLLTQLFARESRSPAPEISIDHHGVTIGNCHHPFFSERFDLKKIDIRSEGLVNIIAITQTLDGQGSPDEIRIPVPKGKLREAMVVREKLIAKDHLYQPGV